jgi:hypothetical protein
MIDAPFAVFLVLLALVLGLAVAFDFHRRARRESDRRDRDLREAMGDTLGRDSHHERSSR